jgi:PAS domain S-box-containing protein
MSDPIRILVVEDLETDFELAQREIRKSVKNCTFRLVETREDFLDAIGGFQPDLILSDFSMPRFDGMQALELTLEHAPLTPFIIWTGSMGEDTAVQCMRAGAVNYIIKENIKRLGPAVVHALEERRQLMRRKQAELRYEAIFEQSHDAIFILDLQGRNLAVNRRACDMLGYSRGELLSLSVKDISAEKKQSEDILKRLVAGELIPAYERLFRRKDGSLVPVEINVELVYDAHGNPAHIQSIVRDITERRRVETEILQRNDDLGLLNAINEAVIRGESLDDVVTLLGKEMKRIFDTVGSTVYMLSSDRQFLTMQQYYMLPALTRKIEEVIGSTIPLVHIPIREGGYFQKALSSSGGRITSDPQEIQGWLGEFVETTFLSPVAQNVIRKLIPALHKLLDIRSVIAIPLISDGQTIGLLNVSGATLFTQDDLNRIEYIGRQLTAALQRQQANERIKRSEEFLQSVQNALSASIAILDETGTIVRVNAAWRKFGEQNDFRHPEHGVGLNYLEICDSAHGAAAGEAREVAAAIREVIAGTREDARFEYTCHSPVEKRWFVLRITKFKDMDRTWVVVAHENITERKQAEQALFESEQRYHGLFENSPVAIWEEDFSELKKHIDSLKGQGVQDFRSYFLSQPGELVACAGMIKVNDVNNTALELYETDSKQRLIEETKRVLTQGEQDHNLEDFVAIAENRTGNSWEGPDETLAGRPIEINLTWSVAPGYEHDYSKVILTTVDITERKRMERERLERLKEMTCLYAVRHDMGLELSIHELCQRIVGHLTHAMQFPEIAVPVIELDGRRYSTSKYNEDLSHCLSVELEVRGKPHGSLRVYYLDDKPFILPEEQDLIKSIADDLRLWLERRQAEESLRQSEERYRTLFDRMLDGVYRSTHEGRFVEVNPAMVRMFGFSSREEMLKVDIKNELYFSPEERGSHLLDSGQEEVDVYRMRRKDGSEIWVEDRGSYVHDEDGNIIYHEGILRDVTERRQTEEALRASEGRFRGLFESSPVAMWEEDFSEVKKYLDSLKQKGVTDFREYFASTPGEVTRCNRMIRVLNVNETAIRMFDAESKEALLEFTNESTSQGEQEHNLEDFVAIAAGRTRNGWEGEDEKLTGKPINISLTWSVVPGHEKDYSRVIVTTLDITDRKRAENELKLSNSLLNAALEATQDGILVVGQDRKISSFNRKFLEMWKVPYSLARHMDDRTLQNFLQEQLKDPSAYIAGVEGFYRSPEIDSFEELELGDGRIFERYSQPQRLGNEIVGRVWSFRNVTERKRAEIERRVLLEIMQGLTHTRDLQEFLKLVHESVAKAIYAENFFAVYYHKETGLFDEIYSVDQYDPPAPPSRLEKSITSHVFRTGEPLIMTQPLFDDLVEKGEVELVGTNSPSWLGVPLKTPEGTIGVITVQNYERSNCYSERDKDFLASIGSQVAIAIERIRAEEELRESEERFRQLADNIKEMFWMTDVVNDREEYISPAFEEIWGFPVERLMQGAVSFLDTVLPDDIPALSSVLERQRQGERTEIEYRITRPDGTVRWIWDRGFPILDDDGKVLRVAGIAADITERKRAQEELRESEQKVQNIVQHSSSMFYSHTADHILTYVSPQSRQILDCEPQEAMMRWQEWLSDHPANMEGVESTERAILTGERQPPYELELITKENRRIWVRVDESPMVEDGKTAAIVGSITDISEYKRAEEQLRKLSRAVEQSASTIVITDRQGNIEYVNPRFTETTGYTSEEAIGQNPRIIKSGQTPQEDYERMWKAITAGEDWQGEFLNRRKNGELFWEYATVSPILNERGETTHFIAVKEDVTDRKRTERDIRRHLAELEALYENGLAVGQLLEPREIGERIIDTFSKHLPWHHVAIRLLKDGSDHLELIAFSLPHNNDDGDEAETTLVRRVSKVGQGISGWVVQTGEPVRTGNVHEYPQYVNTYEEINSGLYMPLRIGDRVLGVISVESEDPDAFTLQDERLLATLANQAAVAFENARLYHSIQQELAERKRAQDALRVSETHYRELADSITDIFFEFDQNLHFTHWNRTSEMLTGVTARDAIGKDLSDVFGDSRELTRVREIYSKVLSTRRPKTFETLFPLNREIRSLEINAYPSTRGVSVVAKDVTDRKRSEAIMQKRFELMEFSARHSLEEVARKITDEVSELTGSRIGFFHFMAEDERTINMQVWSTNTPPLFHASSDEEKHLPVDQAGVWAEAVHQRRSLIHNEYVSLPNKKGLPSGHGEITREMLIPVIRNEKIVAVMGVANKSREYTQQDLDIAMQFADYAWDITERKQMEVELASERNLLAQRVEERTSELRASNVNLARALRVKDEFLANMSHELRTPLNAVLGLSESLSEQVAGPLNEKQLRYVTTISESGNHLLSLINDILDLAKIEAGQVKLDIGKMNVNLVCEASLRMVKQQAQKKNLHVSLDIAPDLGLIWADERRLKQMIVNLLSNAVKFTPENGRIGLEVHGGAGDNKVTFTVWDNGIGIKEADLARLFQPFMQLDAGLARESSGTGLGLVLVSQMARLHGGGIKVESKPGQGSRFTIVLPWQPAIPMSHEEKLRQTGKLGPTKSESRKRTKILLIEDTREVVMMIQDYLEVEGYTVITAQDGLDGISQAKLTHPDLILMDLQMPRMDGLEASRRLRSEPGFKHTPIIAVTALAMPNDRERCLAAGMNEYVTKPVNLKALVKTIRKCLSTAEEKTSPL